MRERISAIRFRFLSHRQAREKLSEDQINLLDRLNFVWDVLGDAWEQGYSALVGYVGEHLRAQVPKSYATIDGYKLGAWDGKQRNRRDQLSEGQIKRLDQLGFVWDVLGDAWEQGYSALVGYVEEYSHAQVPKSYVTPDGYRLGTWVDSQRQKRG